MINQTLLDWYGKKQAAVEKATFGPEFVAARTATDQIVHVRTSLPYLGVHVHGKTIMLGDNKSVVTNATMPHSKLNKQHQALCYRRVREAIASGMMGCYHIPGENNPADILSKHWGFVAVWPLLKPLLFWKGETKVIPTKVKELFFSSIQARGESYNPHMKIRGNGSSVSYLVNATHVTEDIWELEFPAGTL